LVLMRIFVYLLLCLIWGSTWIAIKIGLSDAPPLWAASFRFAIAISIMYAIMRIRRLSLPTNLGRVFRLAYPGLFIYGASYMLIYLAEVHIDSALTSILFASFPLFIAVLSLWMLKAEPLSVPGWFGIGLGICGMIVIALDSFRTSDELFVGVSLALAASLAAAYGILLHKKVAVGENMITVAGLQMVFGAIPILLVAIVFEDLASFNLTAKAAGSVAYLAVFGTVIAFLGYYWLLNRIRVVAVSLIGFVTPLIAIFIGVGLFGERLSLETIWGTGLILSGIVLILRK